MTTIQKEFSTIKEFKDLLNEVSSVRTKDGYLHLEATISRKVTPKFEEKLVEIMKKHKVAIVGNNLGVDAVKYVTLTNLADFKNEELVSIIEHNTNEFNALLARKEEVSKLNNYIADTSDIEELQLEFNPFKNEFICSKYSTTLSSVVKSAMDYDGYVKSSGEYLSPRAELSLDIDFQRDLVWDLGMKQRLISAILREDSIGSITINKFNQYFETENNKNLTIAERNEINDVVIDGKQRISTIISFLNGEFPLTIEGKDYYYHNMKTLFILKFSKATILVSEYNIDSKKELIKCYLELNKNKIEHTEADFEVAKTILNSL